MTSLGTYDAWNPIGFVPLCPGLCFPCTQEALPKCCAFFHKEVCVCARTCVCVCVSLATYTSQMFKGVKVLNLAHGNMHLMGPGIRIQMVASGRCPRISRKNMPVLCVCAGQRKGFVNSSRHTCPYVPEKLSFFPAYACFEL